MKTMEIINSFTKGGTVGSISDNQKSWLINVAVHESGVLAEFDGHQHNIYFDDCFFSIKNCYRHASGGSYVGKKLIPGRFNIYKRLKIRFTDTGLKFVHTPEEVERIKRDGYEFEVINPKTN